MPDPILDDVQTLLDKEFGDKRILEQILRAAKNDEVISNFERNYVRKLAEKHLGKKPLVEKKAPEEPKRIIPEVVTPPPIKKPQTLQTWSEPPRVTKSDSKNNKIMIGVGLLALAIIVIAAVSLSGDSGSTPTIIQEQTPTPLTSSPIQTDVSSYNKGDIISISGKSTENQVNLSILNANDKLVWSEQVNVRSDGQFSTLTFAGGNGWEESGIFTIIAEDDSETNSNTFFFNG